MILSYIGDRVCLQCGMRLEPRKPGFNPNISHMRFVVDKLDMGKVSSLPVPRFALIVILPMTDTFLHSNTTIILQYKYV